MINGFVKTHPYFDDKNFPRGFARSGEFTIPQVDILESLGRTLLALENGVRKPETPEEKQFIAVCKGLSGEQTVIERTWKKYRQLTTKSGAGTAFGRGASSEDFNRGNIDRDIS